MIRNKGNENIKTEEKTQLDKNLILRKIVKLKLQQHYQIKERRHKLQILGMKKATSHRPFTHQNNHHRMIGIIPQIKFDNINEMGHFLKNKLP